MGSLHGEQVNFTRLELTCIQILAMKYSSECRYRHNTRRDTGTLRFVSFIRVLRIWLLPTGYQRYLTTYHMNLIDQQLRAVALRDQLSREVLSGRTERR